MAVVSPQKSTHTYNTGQREDGVAGLKHSGDNQSRQLKASKFFYIL